MPAAKKPTRSTAARTTAQFKEPLALKRLSTSLDAAQEALAELRQDAGRDVGQGARELYKDLRTFISSARRDSSKLATALRRDFEQAQKRLAEPSRPARASTQPRAARSRRAARPSTKAASNARSATAAATPPPTQRAPAGTTRSAILHTLASGEAMTAAQIAIATGLSRGTVSTTLSRLVASGEITKAQRGYRLPAL